MSSQPSAADKFTATVTSVQEGKPQKSVCRRGVCTRKNSREASFKAKANYTTIKAENFAADLTVPFL